MQNNTYKTTTLKFPNAVVRVHRPELTPEERNRRMTAIHKASVNLLKEVERKKSYEKGIECSG